MSPPTMTTATQYSSPKRSLMSCPAPTICAMRVKGHHDEGRGSREHAHRRLGEAEGRHVREGELPEVPQPLGHEEGQDRPAHEETDGIDQPVEARGHHGCRNPEEGGRRHVVARDGEPVLKAGDAAARGVEVGGGLGLGRGPFGDEEREDHEGREHADGGEVRGLLLDLAQIRARGQRQRRQQDQRGHGHCKAARRRETAHWIAPRRTFSVRSSNSRLARIT